MKRADRDWVRRYLQHLSGSSRAQISRAVQRWMTLKPLCRPLRRPSNAFAQRYTAADLDALSEVECEYGRLSGPATVVVQQCIYQVYGDDRFVRLEHLSASHLYNLRRSVGYQARHTARAMLAQFPFEIRGFHSDGGSEYVNYEVGKMLDDARIDFTHSRPRRCNDKRWSRPRMASWCAASSATATCRPNAPSSSTPFARTT